MRRISCTIEFTWEATVPGGPVADIDCRATADVLLGEPESPWIDDPGSGDEVWQFRDIEVYIGPRHYVDADWLEPFILDYLMTGAQDEAFAAEARGSGGRCPDLARDLKRETA